MAPPVHDGPVIAIVAYGLGNVRSISNMLRKAGVSSLLATTPSDVRAADAAILPGVGSFDAGMQRLNESGLRPAVEDVVASARPLLGICLGMQMLGLRSEEGQEEGIGILNAETRRLTPGGGLPVPHMGWTGVTPTRASALFPSELEGRRFYFLHSFQMHCDDPEDLLATADYGVQVTAAVGRENVVGVQFHPEKSHRFGLELLRAWVGKV